MPTLLMENEGLIPSMLETKMDTMTKHSELQMELSPPLLERASSCQQAGTETQDLSNSTTQTVNTGEAAGKTTVT